MSENNKSIGLNELVDYKPKTYSPTMEKIMKFLWKCSGADPEILKYSPYSDHIKSAGIGGVVLATSVMAALAMGFAMHSIFGGENSNGEHEGNWFITIPVAIVWGLIIYNLDRFIVTTAKGDGTEKITLGEWGSMLPRLVMAVLIGLCISAPLETYIFRKEIQREWKNVSNKMAISRGYEIEQKYRERASEIQAELNKADSAFKESNTRFNDLDKDISDLQAGVGKYAGKACTAGPTCPRHREMYVSRDKAEQDKLRYSSELDVAKSKLNFELNSKKSEDSLEKSKIESQLPGFLDQIMMLEGLSSKGKEVEKYNAVTGDVEMKKDENGNDVAVKEEIYGSAFWPIWLVRLLFMIIEIAPVIFKFMIWKSSYDYMQDNVAQILEAKQGISLEHIIDENNNMHKVKENYNARRIVEVSKRQNELEKENAIHAITLYAEKEREEMERNPEKFIKNQGNPTDSPVDNPVQDSSIDETPKTE